MPRSARGSPASAATVERLFAGPGEMRALMRATDWARTPLGPVSGWPQSLRTALSICVASRFPMFVWWGPDLVMLYNDAYRPMLGATKHPRALGSPGAVIWAEVWDVIGPMFRSVMERGEATWSADQLLLTDRYGYVEETYFTFSYSPIEDESGGVGGVFCAVTETTERVIGERRLRRLRELGAPSDPALSEAEVARGATDLLVGEGADVPYAALYTLSSDGATLTRVAAAGAGFAEAPAVLAVGAGGWPLADAAWNAVRAGLPVSLEALPGRGEAMALPVRGGAGDQVTGVLLAGASPRRRLDEEYRGFLELAAGHVGGRLAAARAYDAERRRAEALAELDRAKTAFFSNVSHELRTPLTLQLGPLQDLLADGAHPLTARQQELVRLAYRNSQRLLKLVNTLLEFSRIEAGRVTSRFEATDLAALTTDLARNFREAIERTGLRFTVDAPTLSEPVWVDRAMWEKIVLNLLSNALKYTLHGGITLTLRREGGAIELAVADTGTGIPAEEVPRLFTRFHRVNNPHGRTQEGTGIGLALVAELVRLHGGEVAVESEEGRGSVFRVRIPLGREHLAAEHVVEAPERTTAALDAAPYVAEALRWDQADEAGTAVAADADVRAAGVPADLSGARVLVADDNADMREYLRGLLAETFEVETVADGRAALGRARLAPPDLVLADVMMPQLDGFALLDALRADPVTREVPVVLVSARAGEEARAEGLAAGADDYLVKPFAARELLARVAGAVRLARQRREWTEARRSVEAEAQNRLAVLEAVFASAPVGLCILDHDLRYVRINDRLAEMNGIPAAEHLGRTIHEMVPEIAPLVEPGFRRALETGEPVYDLELRGATAAEPGRERVWLESWYPFRGSDGRVAGLSVVAHEVTAERRAVADLVESHGRLRLATEAAGLGIFSWDVVADHPMWHNERMYQILGRTREQGPIGYRELVEEVLFPEDVAPFEAAMKAAMRPEGQFAWRGRMRLSYGVRWIEYYARFELLPDGSPARLLGVLRDVTEQQEVEERLRHAQRMEAAGQLAGGIAHEANNQMTVVLGATHFLQREPMLPPQVREDLRTIERAAQRTSTITRQLLAFSRRQLIQPVVLSLNELLVGLERVIVRTVTDAVRLVLDLDPADPKVRADRGQLEQVVINLVLNARDAMPTGGLLRLRTGFAHLDRDLLRQHGYGSARAGWYSRLDVSDSGIGMTGSILARAFEPFFTTKAPGEGTGLGLAAVYGIIQQAGGYVWARSEPGIGTEVTICLPLEAEPAATAPPPAGGTAATGARELLLVAEDDATVRAMAVRVLREQGHRVLEAEHGAEALELLQREGGVAAVVTDVVMPVMGGRELAEAMAAAGFGTVPILYMSGFTGDDVIRRGLLEEGRPFLQKPFMPEDLVERVQGLLDASPRRAG